MYKRNGDTSLWGVKNVTYISQANIVCKQITFIPLALCESLYLLLLGF